MAASRNHWKTRGPRTRLNPITPGNRRVPPGPPGISRRGELPCLCLDAGSRLRGPSSRGSPGASGLGRRPPLSPPPALRRLLSSDVPGREAVVGERVGLWPRPRRGPLVVSGTLWCAAQAGVGSTRRPAPDQVPGRRAEGPRPRRRACARATRPAGGGVRGGGGSSPGSARPLRAPRARKPLLKRRSRLLTARGEPAA